jgi:hypothetical protein
MHSVTLSSRPTPHLRNKIPRTIAFHADPWLRYPFVPRIAYYVPENRFQGVQSRTLSAFFSSRIDRYGHGRVFSFRPAQSKLISKQCHQFRRPAVRANQAHAVAVGAPTNREEMFGVYGSVRWIQRCAENLLTRSSRLILLAQCHGPIREEGSVPHFSGTAPSMTS